ncbi:nucleocapsid protein [Alternaria dianthicola negative-stranded RNA virus 1]|uniref:Nucleocapsid protein n=1 Tax=Alternaria dianthicola negative-stranded RNA virus 1 TaxID=2992032 RepID=A0A9E8ACX0_9MONO|nr:nucleocapsid protein [Alternaria dianthicola negative-stranded RNA virus 1]
MSANINRPIPTSFVNQSTYGVNTNLNRDRLPKIPDNVQVDLEAILSGKSNVPSRIALAGIQVAEDHNDIIRLVIGAMLDASKTTATAAKLKNVWKDINERDLLAWGLNRLTGVTSSSVAEESPSGEDPVSVALPPTTRSSTNHFPTAGLPMWVTELEMTDDDVGFAMTVSNFEICAYAGVLAYAIAKQPTAQNLEAFNQNRRNVVREYMATGEMQIFIDESKFLDLNTLGKVHRAFNTAIKDRALVISAIVDHDSDLVSGVELMFYAIFRLTAGASLNPLLIIVRYARIYPQFYDEFKDLHTEYHAAHHALQRFLDVSEKQRMYLKVIFGSSYVPVPRDDVNKLLGCAVFALQQSESSLANYKGGVLSVEHRNKLITLLNVVATREEEVPEETTT